MTRRLPLRPFCRGLSLWSLLLIVLLPGCGRSGSDGTSGVLRLGHEPLGNVRVTVNCRNKNSIESIGFGVTDDDGIFHLVSGPAGQGLRLSQGEYRFTLKSVGSPVRIPNEYAQVNDTPLKLSWPGGDENLELDVAFKTLHSSTAPVARE
jgi:hypothetical protein